VRDGSDDTIFIAFEVDNPIEPLMAATAVLGSDLALVIAAAFFLVADAEFFLGGLRRSVISEKSLTDAPRRPGVTGL
jgi:hypothetical protein